MGKHAKEEIFTPEQREVLKHAPVQHNHTPRTEQTADPAPVMEKPRQTGPDLLDN
jgi:hypothetical protein